MLMRLLALALVVLPGLPMSAVLGKTTVEVQVRQPNSPDFLASYPRPPGVFGLHDTPIIGGSVNAALAVRHWQSLGVRLVTVLDPREEMLALAQQAGIEVVARVYSPSIHQDGDLGGVTQRAVAHGMHYVVPYNEPNLRSENSGQLPDPVYFARRWVDAAEIIHQYGGYPVLTPLAPEGDYDDVLFLRKMLTEVVNLRGIDWLLNVGVVVGVHPYLMRPGDDSWGHLETYASVMREQLGFVLPMLATEGGLAGQAAQPAAGWSPEVEVTALAERLRRGDVPEYLLGATLWLYSNEAQAGHDP
ncbi:MAG: hypothetical protein M0Z94_11995, partial [Dehalococcoidales bacterium]|nr:hypothetical protein [Dehalococcoidales bacterium]